MWIGIVMLIVYHLFILYIGWNGWVWLGTVFPHQMLPRYIMIIVLVILAYGLFLGFWQSQIGAFKWIGAVWVAIAYFSVLWLPIMNLVLLLLRWSPISMTTAVFWAGWITVAGLIVTVSVGAYNAYSPVVRSYTIEIDKPVNGPSEMNIVMASDMHFGALSNEGHARRLVERVNALKPDLILLPGDIIDDNLMYYSKTEIPDILKGFQAPVYSSLGNHDRFEDGIDLVDALNQSNLNVLYDESVVLDNGITLVGRRDYSDRPRTELGKLLDEVDHTHPVIVLDHQPYELDAEQKLGTDLVVSGHTHRGQMAPFGLITHRIFENDWGYLRKGQLHSIVSSGFGFWGSPLRIGTRSEIVQIHVKFRSGNDKTTSTTTTEAAASDGDREA
ncbi:metallophosphoesterase [Paenibacillus hunanensis]|uniref:metallophosphoesterase n=1 Tax=Paenibacillus hunanensis TaxID=539262 RepID=UPI002026A765|nr:metallophosphoesterase [Paenibacillus hunanensis]MCL9660988.1 metallophosphoesterase [Paenibacillus hunanensis]